MIVTLRENGVLEMFWRHPVSRQRSFASAESLLARLRHSGKVKPGALRLTARVPGVGRPDDLRELARLIVSGAVTVLEYRGEPMFPSASGPLIRLSDSLLLLGHAEWRLSRDRGVAADWLKNIVPSDSIDHVRERLFARYQRSASTSAGVDDPLAQIKKSLESHDLVPVFHAFPRMEPVEVQGQTAAAAPAPARSDDTVPVTEPKTFDGNHAAPEQVQALVAAAAQGVPFCEVCSRRT